MKKITLLFAMIIMYSFASAQSVDEIINKHIEKTGGKKAYNAVKSISMKGTMNTQGQTMDVIDISTKDGKNYSGASMMGMTFVQLAYDGKTAWHTDQSTMKPAVLGEKETNNAKLKVKSFPTVYINYKKNGFKIELAGTETFNNEECYKLKVTPSEGDAYFNFISKESYYEVGTIRTFEQMGRKFTMNASMSDFKEVSGLIMPFKIVQNVQGQSMPLTVNSYEINGKIDESIFTM